MDVGTEGTAQGFVKQVGGGMVPLDGGAAIHVNLGFCRFAAGHAAFDDVAEVQEGITLFLRVCDGEDAVCGADGAGVADLSAGFAVERGAVKDDNALFAAEQAVDRCAVGEDLHDLRGAVVVFVTLKGGFAADIKFLRGVEFTSGFGALALRRHFPLKAVAVEFDAEFARHVGGEVVGEAVGVIEFEDDFAGDDQLAVCEVIVQVLFQRGDVGGGFRIAEFGFVAKHVFHIDGFRLALRGTQQDLFAVCRLQGANVEGFAVSGVQFDGFLRSVQRQEGFEFEEFQAVQHFVEDVHAGIQRLRKALFFPLDGFGDARFGFNDFRIGLAHFRHQRCDEFVEERLVLSQFVAVADGAAHDAAQDVAAPFVAGQYAIDHQEDGGADVVGDDFERGLVEIVAAGCLSGSGNQVAEDVDFVVGMDVLQHGGDAFQPHAGIDGRARQWFHVARRIPLELHEDDVPDFDEAVAVFFG